jgi:TolA-binding protein
MRKSERHQIKQDDLVTLFERVVMYVEGNLRTVALVAAAAVVIAVAAGGIRFWMAGTQTRASLLVGEMIETFHAPISQSVQDLQQSPLGVSSFTSLEERDRKVLELAESILSDHATAAAVPKALYYKGLALANLKRHEDAAATMETFLKTHSRDFLAPMVRYQLARVLEAQGKLADALVHFEVLAGGSGAFFPKEEGLLGVARCQEALGQKSEALKTYKQILNDHPESEYFGEARSKIADLS